MFTGNQAVNFNREIVEFNSTLSVRWQLCFLPSRAKLDWKMEEISKILIVGVWITAGVLLFTPYEAVLETILALLLFAAVLLGFFLQPRRDVFYVRTTVLLSDADRNQTLEHDFLAVKVELVRLWLLFLPTFLALAFLVVSSAGGILWKLSFLNNIFSTRYAFIALYLSPWVPLVVLILQWAWIRERWVMIRYVNRQQMMSWRAVDVDKLIAEDHRARAICEPNLNKIAMGLLFHRLTIPTENEVALHASASLKGCLLVVFSWLMPRAYGRVFILQD
jgi:hypothetical protein